MGEQVSHGNPGYQVLVLFHVVFSPPPLWVWCVCAYIHVYVPRPPPVGGRVGLLPLLLDGPQPIRGGPRGRRPGSYIKIIHHIEYGRKESFNGTTSQILI